MTTLSKKFEKVMGAIFWPLFVCVTTLTFYYQTLLLQYRHWVDEDETVVVSKMLAHGFKLYSEVFNNHGPLAFLPGIILESVGNFSVPEHRIPVIILQLLILLSVYASPIIPDKFSKATCSILVGLVFVIVFPSYLGHTNQYGVLAGGLLAIAFSVYVIPSMLNRAKLETWRVAVGSFLLGSVAFLSFTFWPALFLIFLISLRREHSFPAFLWLLIAVVFNVVVLFLVGSVVGYIVDHLYFNIVVLASYYQITSPLIVLKKIFNTFISNKLLSGWVIGSFALLFYREKSIFRWKSVLLFLACISFFYRGMNFHAMAGLYPILVLCALLIGSVISKRGNKAAFFSVIALWVFTLTAPWGHQYRRALMKARFPVSSDFSRLVQSLTDKDDRIIAYTLKNMEYLLADRLPASGAFFYLPWQAKYNENPKFGIRVDPCRDIELYRPKIMLIDKWRILGRGTCPWDSYAGCIQKIIDKDYRKIPHRPFYVRNDIWRDNRAVVVPQASKIIE